ncbi:helix-turn-helix transcriptional regulator [Nostoc minutum NIES-26]|uniref:Helix-turn-helix transcriptional regulator n=1 Tax=Nostoc minutum NIES-26 TaxID=1844469 RepID=A0A367RVR9_9NOSO|nr:response regulator transcription factor [Dendronalium sp. ChiSLP03b]MDZ8207238.1 response regulator transcription factor [Dendronalium sp. ChiSLP03b]RCJ40707.1 helix-turn-helix transcriptional regulator [Nostoc minutum NIES-26]
MIRVMVVATSPVVRAGLSAVVTSNPRLTVVGSASNLDVLAREVEQLQPDVVLLDLSGNLLPVWDKLLLIQEKQYSLGMVVIVEELDSIDLEGALRSGVRGILPSTSTELEIAAAVEAIAFGLVVLHPDAVQLVPVREKIAVNPVQTLTPREIEVLEMLGSGLGNKAIAKRLHISEHTVKFHLSSIFQKLGVSTRTEAVTVGVRLGLIML